MLEFHPIANVFPLIEGEEFNQLVADIAANGVNEPIWLYEDKILDGRNRASAAEAAEVECPTRLYEGEDPVGFVISANLRRRHLDTSQRAMCAARIADLPKGANQHDQIRSPSREQASEMLNVGKSTVQLARDVQQNGVPELGAAVDRGEIAVSTAAEITSLPPEEQSELVARGRDEILAAAKRIRAETQRGTTGTGENEWYTPKIWIDRVRAVLGEIDLGPTSSEQANKVVGAKDIFTKETNGLDKEWWGRVYMNPPYSQPLIEQFMLKMVEEVASGRVEEAITLTHNYTDTKWFQIAAQASSAICFTRGRVKFYSPDGTVAAPTQGQAFMYFGTNVEKFVDIFGAPEVGFVRVAPFDPLGL